MIETNVLKKVRDSLSGLRSLLKREFALEVKDVKVASDTGNITVMGRLNGPLASALDGDVKIEMVATPKNGYVLFRSSMQIAVPGKKRPNGTGFTFDRPFGLDLRTDKWSTYQERNAA